MLKNAHKSSNESIKMKMNAQGWVMLAVTSLAAASLLIAPADKRKQLIAVSAFSLVISLFYIRQINNQP